MRNIILIFCALALFSCSSEVSETKHESKNIIGTWQYVEFRGLTYLSSGEVSYAHSVEDGYIYNFSENNVVTTDKYSCNGTYEFNPGALVMDFDCPDAGYSSTYDVVFEDDLLVLTPNPNSCDEGCTYVYKKI